MNGLKIDEKEFEALPVQKQLVILYKNTEEIRVGLRKRKKTDTALTAATGFIGGVFAVIGKWFFLKG